MSNSSSGTAWAPDKKGGDDPQFTLTGGNGFKYQQGISFVYFLVLIINFIITTSINNFVKAYNDFGGAEVHESEQDIAAQEAAWAQQRGESLPSKRFGLSQPQHIHT